MIYVSERRYCAADVDSILNWGLAQDYTDLTLKNSCHHEILTYHRSLGGGDGVGGGVCGGGRQVDPICEGHHVAIVQSGQRLESRGVFLCSRDWAITSVSLAAFFQCISMHVQ